MTCPQCDRSMIDNACICGYQRQLADDCARRRHGLKLCEWMTASKLCLMTVSGEQRYCNWHHEWERLLETPEAKDGQWTEFQKLQQWLTQFQPGGEYGANPGQWWADVDSIIGACHGLWELKPRSERLKRDMSNEHWEMMKKMKHGIYSEQNQRRLKNLLKVQDVLESVKR